MGSVMNPLVFSDRLISVGFFYITLVILSNSKMNFKVLFDNFQMGNNE